jgi:uncharacterized protein (TIGR00251 family)
VGEELRGFVRTATGLRVHVLAQPRASRDAILGVHDGQLKIALRSAPVEGEANASLVAFLAKALGVPKKAVALAQGEASRRKTVIVAGDPAALEAALIALVG